MDGRRTGRRTGGRGNINMTTAELNALIADRVAEALAAHEAARVAAQGGNTPVLNSLKTLVSSFTSNLVFLLNHCLPKFQVQTRFAHSRLFSIVSLTPLAVPRVPWDS